MSIIDIQQRDLPMCPNSFGLPGNPAHQLHNRILDTLHRAIPHDEDTGEAIDPKMDEVYAAAAYETVSDRMYLYHDSVSFHEGRARHAVVESWYFRCGVCGLVLPANRMPEAGR